MTTCSDCYGTGTALACRLGPGVHHPDDESGCDHPVPCPCHCEEPPVSVPDPLSPDCEQRKHTACSGDAWNHLRDEPADCTCECHRRNR